MKKLKRLPRTDSDKHPADPDKIGFEQNLADLAKDEKPLSETKPLLPAPKENSFRQPQIKLTVKKKHFLRRSLSPKLFITSMLGLLILASGFLGVMYYLGNPPMSQVSKLAYNPVTQEPVSLTLNITNPTDNSLVFSEDLLVSGKASPNTVVFLSINDTDQVLDVSPLGNFSQTIKLQPGVSQIFISAVDESGNTKGGGRIVYYSKEKL